MTTIAQPFVRIPNLMVRSKRHLPDKAWSILELLMSHKEGFKTSFRDIAKSLGFHQATVAKHVKSLVSLGFLSFVRSCHKDNSKSVFTVYVDRIIAWLEMKNRQEAEALEAQEPKIVAFVAAAETSTIEDTITVEETTMPEPTPEPDAPATETGEIDAPESYRDVTDGHREHAMALGLDERGAQDPRLVQRFLAKHQSRMAHPSMARRGAAPVAPVVEDAAPVAEEPAVEPVQTAADVPFADEPVFTEEPYWLDEPMFPDPYGTSEPFAPADAPAEQSPEPAFEDVELPGMPGPSKAERDEKKQQSDDVQACFKALYRETQGALGDKKLISLVKWAITQRGIDKDRVYNIVKDLYTDGVPVTRETIDREHRGARKKPSQQNNYGRRTHDHVMNDILEQREMAKQWAQHEAEKRGSMAPSIEAFLSGSLKMPR